MDVPEMSTMNKSKRYLLWFANEHTDFKLNELISIAELFKIDLKKIEKVHDEKPFIIVEADCDESMILIANRSVLLRYVIELWSESTQKQEFHDKLKSLPCSFFDQYNLRDKSFKIKVEVFGSSQSHAEKVDKIESFNYLPMLGPVKLKNPDLLLQYIEYYGTGTNGTIEILDYFFGRIVFSILSKVMVLQAN